MAHAGHGQLGWQLCTSIYWPPSLVEFRANRLLISHIADQSYGIDW
jgi:hypothetical protein